MGLLFSYMCMNEKINYIKKSLESKYSGYLVTDRLEKAKVCFSPCIDSDDLGDIEVETLDERFSILKIHDNFIEVYYRPETPDWLASDTKTITDPEIVISSIGPIDILKTFGDLSDPDKVLDGLSRFIEVDFEQKLKEYHEFLLEHPKTGVRFDSDIIITDPCYLFDRDSWYKIDFRTGFGQLCYTRFIWGDTIYGDWSCGTFVLPETCKDPYEYIESDTRDLLSECNKIGDFCADAGLVGVFCLSEVPEGISILEEKSARSRTIIKDFHGTASYYIDKNNDAHIVLQEDGETGRRIVTFQTGI